MHWRGLGWACLATLALPLGSAHAVCRVIEPAVDSGHVPVAFDPTTALLYVRIPDYLWGYECPGLTELSSSRECPDGSIGREVKDTRIVLFMQPRLVPRAGRAALILPVPRGATVERGAPELFNAIALATRTRVRETISFREDITLGVQCGDPHYSRGLSAGSPGPAGVGCASDVGTTGAGAGRALDAGSFTRDAGWDATVDAWVEALDGAVVDASMLEAGALDAGGDPWTPDLPPSTEIGQLPVIDAYTMESIVGVPAIQGRLDELGLAPRAADLEALARYEATHDFAVLVVEPPDLRDVWLAGLRPIMASWRGEEMPLLEELVYDPSGATIFTQAYVAGPERSSLEDGRGVEAFAETMIYPADIADFAGGDGWITRIDVARNQREWVEDTRFVRAAIQQLAPNEIERTRAIRIAAACCADGSVPAGWTGGRTFIETFEYLAGDEPSLEDLFYCAPPPTSSECSGWESSSDAGFGWEPDGGSWSCGYDPPASSPPPPRRGCCGGRCSVGGTSALESGSAWGLVLTGVVAAVRSGRRRRARARAGEDRA